MTLRPLGEPVEGWVAPLPPGPAVLEGRYARLERLDPARHGNDPHAANGRDAAIWDYLSYGPFDDAGYRVWIEGMAALSAPFFYAVVDCATGRAAGVASFLRILPTDGSIEVGHVNFAPALQGTRVATEAMTLMMAWAFTAGCRRYEWKCNALNVASRRAAQRLGFGYEGLFRQATVSKGRNRDTAWFAVIDQDWPALRAAFETWLAPANFDEKDAQRQSLSVMTRPLLGARDPLLDAIAP